jgi:hypothetical protein
MRRSTHALATGLPRCALLGVAFLGLVALGASATTVAPLTSKQVEALADRIFEGRCVSVAVVPVEGLATPALEYVFEVESVSKGTALAARVADGDRKLVVRQLGGRDEGGRWFGVYGMPAYVPGARYRLSLVGESAIGLTSPVGLWQGVTLLSPPAAKEPAR